MKPIIKSIILLLAATIPAIWMLVGFVLFKWQVRDHLIVGITWTASPALLVATIGGCIVAFMARWPLSARITIFILNTVAAVAAVLASMLLWAALTGHLDLPSD